MIAFPNAKINLGLYITSKRSDGYHDIASCFYPVQWEDAVEIVAAPSFSFTSSGLSIPGNDSSNLVVKTYELLKRNYSLPSCSIHLHKTIPMGAGLGGGSSDAASALLLLNQLFKLSLSSEELIELSTSIGSDCAFFIRNTPCLVSSKGEVLEPIRLSLKGYHLLILHPGIHISTQQAYAGVTPRPLNIDLEKILQQGPESWKETLVNQFEEHLFVEFPELAHIKQTLYDKGAVYASMSGSGSAVYGIFKGEVPAIEWPSSYGLKVVSGQ